MKPPFSGKDFTIIKKKTIWSTLRNYFFAGIVVTIPILITLYITWLFIDFIDKKVSFIIPQKYQLKSIIGFDIPGTGLILGIFLLVIIGFITANFFGKTIIRFGEYIVSKMPLVNTIYGAIKQIFETIFSNKGVSFRQVVLVEFPRKNVREIAFITGKTEGEIQHMTQDIVYNVFVPATPNPTTGFLLFVPKQDLIFLSMSVDEALKMIISGGLVTPTDKRNDEEKNTPIISTTRKDDIIL